MNYRNLAVRNKIAVVFIAIGLSMVVFSAFMLKTLDKVEVETVNF
ncbi:MAG: methyl-accepting chemotaxis protein, partial [Aliivibrio sp.]|nr:methyl-accepting chemotaxis protein [Aliivibrio sp.]